jgi:ketosteroid isomerase-like protein
MDREHVAAWVAAYERAWRRPGTDRLVDLFTGDAVYRRGPFRQPVIGLAAIARMWEDEHEGPDEEFEMTNEIVAIDGDTAVVRVEVTYDPPRLEQHQNLWIVRFANELLCRSFEEWPFAP